MTSIEPCFSQQFLAHRIEYYRKMISLLPNGIMIYRDGVPYIRIKQDPSGKKVPYERSLNTDEGKKLLKLVELRDKCQSVLDYSLNSWKTNYKGVIPQNISYVKSVIDTPDVMTCSYYKKVQANSNPAKNPTSYVYDGLALRSRFEMLAAEGFNRLKIEFKYEVPIECGDTTYYLDMLAYIPEKNRCVGFEFAGKFEDAKYMNDNLIKTMNYINYHKLIPNRDIITLWGGELWTPSVETIMNAIIFGVENC